MKSVCAETAALQSKFRTECALLHDYGKMRYSNRLSHLKSGSKVNAKRQDLYYIKESKSTRA
jgi:hypothetical protein